MENLKDLLDSKSLTDINNELHQFVHSAEGYENRLKLVFALLYLVNEADAVVKSVDLESFISDIRERVGELDGQSEKLGAEYHAHIAENTKVAQILAGNSNDRIEDIQHQISMLLAEYDDVIKKLVETREKMSIEQQISAERAS